jgi:hypothetical protein
MSTGCGSRILPGAETEGAFALATGSLDIRHKVQCKHYTIHEYITVN